MISLHIVCDKVVTNADKVGLIHLKDVVTAEIFYWETHNFYCSEFTVLSMANVRWKNGPNLRIVNSMFIRYLRVHYDVIEWKHFPRYWSFVRGINRSPVISYHKGQWRRALMFSLTCAWLNGWVNSGEAGDLRHHCAHYDDTVVAYRDLHHPQKVYEQLGLPQIRT